MGNILGTKLITQIAILVHDIEKTSKAFGDFLGVEKPQWSITDSVDKAQTQYRGKPSEARAKLAFFDMGSLQLELIEPDHNPSTWRESLDKNGEGPHHIAFEIEGMKDKKRPSNATRCRCSKKANTRAAVMPTSTR
jgi:methylmalonyl-CoA/ethylmalonyl-CoA epimerase